MDECDEKNVIVKKKRYERKCIYWKNERYWLLYDRYNKQEFHTHVPFNKKNAAIMILKMAEKGEITKHYPQWMIHSVNRLWFGKDYKLNSRLDNTNLLTNSPEVRIKSKSKKKLKRKNIEIILKTIGEHERYVI